MSESPDRSGALAGQMVSASMGMARAVTTEAHCGYVALLDALGFSDLVAGDRGGKNVLKYIGAVSKAVENCGLPAIAFSDTILLTIDGEGPETLLKMVKACSHLLGEMIRASIPVRGAITFGEFVRSDNLANGVFVAGRPILDAYHFEQQQNWVGVLLAPSTLETVREHNLQQICNRELEEPIDSYRTQLQWKGYLQTIERIPFHEPPNPNFYKGLAVVPGGSDDLRTLYESIDRAIKALTWMQAVAPSPKEQRKHQATIAWLTEMQPLWKRYLR